MNKHIIVVETRQMLIKKLKKKFVVKKNNKLLQVSVVLTLFALLDNFYFSNVDSNLQSAVYLLQPHSKVPMYII